MWIHLEGRMIEQGSEVFRKSIISVPCITLGELDRFIHDSHLSMMNSKEEETGFTPNFRQYMLYQMLRRHPQLQNSQVHYELVDDI